MNKELMEKIACTIEANPQHFEMNGWLQDNNKGTSQCKNIPKFDITSCGTTACIAGWTCLLANPPLDDMSASARVLLGLSYFQAESLFYRTGWPRQFRYSYFTSSPEERAQLAAARIRHMIATGE